MGIETAIALGISAAGSAYQMIQGANAKSQADQAASNAASQLAQLSEADRFKSLQVPTLGLELAQQNIQQRQAQQMQGLQDIGAAGVLGGTTALNVQGQKEDLALAAQAQQAQYERDLAQAENAQRIEANRIARQSGLEQSRLQGAQLSASQAQANQNAGLAGLASTAGQFAVEAFKNQPLYDQTKVNLGAPGTKNQEMLQMQNNVNQMYNRGQGLLKNQLPVGLSAIPTGNQFTPRMPQNIMPYQWMMSDLNSGEY
jgi:hypothetical protein